MTDLFDAPATTGNEVKLEDLVGDGKKFKSVEDLVRGKLEADRFIEQIKQENQELREDLATRARVEEVIGRLNPNTSSQKPTEETPPNHEGNPSEGAASKPVDIDAAITAALEKRETANRQTSNVNEVKSTLSKVWGDGYASKLAEAAATLDMSKEDLNRLAANNPKLFYRAIGVDPNAARQEESLFTPPSSAINAEVSTSQGVVRNKAYYDKMRRENPTEYFKPHIQNQRFQDAARLGDRFNK
jgi:hypothetical protein